MREKYDIGTLIIFTNKTRQQQTLLIVGTKVRLEINQDFNSEQQRKEEGKKKELRKDLFHALQGGASGAQFGADQFQLGRLVQVGALQLGPVRLGHRCQFVSGPWNTTAEQNLHVRTKARR